MAVDNGPSISLPSPPPPRPVARQAAIEAALRKFDGELDAGRPVREPPKRKWWANMHRRPAGALVTAALIAVVSVPAAMIALREQPTGRTASDAPAFQPKAENGSTADALQAPADEQIASEPPAPSARGPVPLPLEPHTGNSEATTSEQKTTDVAPAPAVMAAPAAAPPPPPPPPPPAPARETEEQYAADSAGQEMVVTGSRIAQPNLEKPSPARVTAGRSAAEAKAAGPSEAYGEFLSRLQAAVRAGNRRAVIRLVSLPLRVNFEGGARSYADRSSIERDFERIFTGRVRQAILAQRADRLFTNYQGAMIGDGEVWFDQTCSNASCSPPGPVRIKAVSPGSMSD